jgi:hypothetical protein
MTVVADGAAATPVIVGNDGNHFVTVRKDHARPRAVTPLSHRRVPAPPRLRIVGVPRRATSASLRA